jgi:chromosome segregation ATPase
MDSFITNLTINSKFKVLTAINRHPHYYAQLRECEQFILKQSEAISFNEGKRKAAEINLQIHQLEIEELKQKLDVCLSKKERLKLQLQITEIEHKVNEYVSQFKVYESLLRDAKMELQVAQEEKARILMEYPELLSISFDEAQDTLAIEAYVAEMQQSVGAKLLAAQTGIPEDVALFLAGIPQDGLLVIMKGAESYCRRLGVSISSFLSPTSQDSLPTSQE